MENARVIVDDTIV